MSNGDQSGTLYAGTNAGVFRSADRGASWQAISDGLTDVSVLSLAIDLQNDILYAGTDGAGVYRSDDRGQSWLPANQNFREAVRALVLDEQTSTLYSGTSIGVFGSTDGGKSWQPVGSKELRGLSVSALMLDSRSGTLYVGAGVWVFRSIGTGESWQPLSESFPGDGVQALALDVENDIVYAGAYGGGVFRSLDDGGSWVQVSETLTNYEVTSLVVDAGRGMLYVGTSIGVFRSADEGLSWRPGGKESSNRVLSLALDPGDGTLYAGTLGTGAFRSIDGGESWEPASQGLLGRNVYALALKEGAQAPAVAVIAGGLYWKERFPVEPARLEASRQALKTLRAEYEESDENLRNAYPWRLGFAPSTGLPALLRSRLISRLEVGYGEISPRFRDLLSRNQAQATFGIRDEDEDSFWNTLDEQFEPGPVIGLNGGEDGSQARTRHFTYRQVYHGYQVIGGSARLHGLLEDERLVITSSYFPIPKDYSFAPDAKPGEDPLSPRLTPEEARQRAQEAVIQAMSIQDEAPGSTALTQPSLADEQIEALTELLGRAEGGPKRWLLLLVIWLLRQGGILRWLGALLFQLLFVSELSAQAVPPEIVPIGGRDLAILPFAGAYRLISRFRIRISDADPWYADVDMKTGQVLGSPWQAMLGMPNYFKTSGEAASAIPSGQVANLLSLPNMAAKRQELKKHLPSLDDLINGATSETVTVAAHALLLYGYLRDTCQIEQDAFQDGPVLSFNLNLPNDKSMGFAYDKPDSPVISFWPDSSGNGVRVVDEDEDGNPVERRVYKPATDPEVLLHELVHAYLWLLNADPWDTQDLLERNPFGRALHEGYAMYLARSIAAQVPGEEQQFWARAAYPEVTHGPTNFGWGNHWAFARDVQKPGSDFLAAPDVYPTGSYTSGDPKNYKVGMVWARALWDLRELLDAQQADFLIVQAYPYLHGYVANFELAAEGLLDVDLKKAEHINLANGSQPIWRVRGITAGQGVHGFARADNGTLIAATDTGILRSTDQGATWTLDQAGDSPDRLTGVVAVAAHGNTLYAAVQLPPNDTAGSGTQWQPDIYRKNFNNPASDWVNVDDWPGDTGEATPLSLLVLGGGTPVVGTSYGVYRHHNGEWRSVGDLTGAPDKVEKNAFPALGMALVKPPNVSRERIRAYTHTSLRQIRTDSLGGDWGLPPGGDFFEGASARPTAIVNWNGDAYVGTLGNGLWKINTNFSTTKVFGGNDMVLALAARDSQLCLATDEDVRAGANLGNLTPLSLPHPDAKVISLFVISANRVLAGTLAHGIWWHDTNGWHASNQPSQPASLELENGEMGLLSFHQPTDPEQDYQINAPGNIALLKVAKPGLSLKLINKNNGTYTLPYGPIIIMLQNNTGGHVALTLTVNASLGAVNISST